MICNFTFKHYEEILKLATEKGYHFLSFRENPDKYKKVIYLRHDIDTSPDNAIKLRKLTEGEIDVYPRLNGTKE